MSSIEEVRRLCKELQIPYESNIELMKPKCVESYLLFLRRIKRDIIKK